MCCRHLDCGPPSDAPLQELERDEIRAPEQELAKCQGRLQGNR